MGNGHAHLPVHVLSMQKGKVVLSRVGEIALRHCLTLVMQARAMPDSQLLLLQEPVAALHLLLMLRGWRLGREQDIWSQTLALSPVDSWLVT